KNTELYWQHVDGYFAAAAAFGLEIIANPLPVDGCGNNTIGIMYLNNNQIKTVSNINAFADFLYNRYGNPSSSHYAPNLIWVVGNDWAYWDPIGHPGCQLPNADQVLFAFASRLQSDERSGGHHLVTSELTGYATSLTNTPTFCPSGDTCPSNWQNVVGISGAY